MPKPADYLTFITEVRIVGDLIERRDKQPEELFVKALKAANENARAANVLRDEARAKNAVTAKNEAVTNTESNSVNVSGENDEEAPATTNTDVDTDTRLALVEEKIESVIETAIKRKSKLGEKYIQVRLSIFPDGVSSMVSRASEGKITLEKKYIAINGDDIWHEYQRHQDVSIETGRRQLPLTSDTIREAIMAIYKPDVVESLFTNRDNPTQRQSFVYAKITSRLLCCCRSGWR